MAAHILRDTNGEELQVGRNYVIRMYRYGLPDTAEYYDNEERARGAIETNTFTIDSIQTNPYTNFQVVFAFRPIFPRLMYTFDHTHIFRRIMPPIVRQPVVPSIWSNITKSGGTRRKKRRKSRKV